MQKKGVPPPSTRFGMARGSVQAKAALAPSSPIVRGQAIPQRPSQMPPPTRYASNSVAIMQMKHPHRAGPFPFWVVQRAQPQASVVAPAPVVVAPAPPAVNGAGINCVVVAGGPLGALRAEVRGGNFNGRMVALGAFRNRVVIGHELTCTITDGTVTAMVNETLVRAQQEAAALDAVSTALKNANWHTVPITALGQDNSPRESTGALKHTSARGGTLRLQIRYCLGDMSAVPAVGRLGGEFEFRAAVPAATVRARVSGYDNDAGWCIIGAATMTAQGGVASARIWHHGPL